MATLLFADDNDILRRVVARMLEQHGHEIIEARSMAEVAAVLESGITIQLAIADVGLPGREDPRIMARVRRLGAKVPLIYISGFPLEEALLRYELRPGAAFFGKPFTARELMAGIDSLLGTTPSGPGAA